jgi:branched-chain amino acid transport system ATP-binding protein
VRAAVVSFPLTTAASGANSTRAQARREGGEGNVDVVHDPEANDEALLRASGVTVRYRNGAHGVSRVDFVARAGEMVAIVGANGAGKSSMILALGGTLNSESVKTEGTVTLRKTNVTNWEPHRRCKLGLFTVSERRKVFPNLTVVDNLLAVRSARRDRSVDDRLREAYNLFPILEERRSSPAGLLSGGQQQMLAVARSLMLDAQVLLIDEMTLGIHQSLRPGLFKAIRRIADTGRAVVIVDESVSLVMNYANRIYALEGGAVVAHGSPAELQDGELLSSVYSGSALS